MSDETDERGYFRHEHTSTASFLFERVTNVELQGFNQQNVISGILIREDGDGIAVDLDPCFGIDARWRCAKAAVVRVTPVGSD